VQCSRDRNALSWDWRSTKGSSPQRFHFNHSTAKERLGTPRPCSQVGLRKVAGAVEEVERGLEDGAAAAFDMRPGGDLFRPSVALFVGAAVPLAAT
jgi:hypothetical protein